MCSTESEIMRKEGGTMCSAESATMCRAEGLTMCSTGSEKCTVQKVE
jgi:hypothetical protein